MGNIAATPFIPKYGAIYLMDKKKKIKLETEI